MADILRPFGDDRRRHRASCGKPVRCGWMVTALSAEHAKAPVGPARCAAHSTDVLLEQRRSSFGGIEFAIRILRRRGGEPAGRLLDASSGLESVGVRVPQPSGAGPRTL